MGRLQTRKQKEDAVSARCALTQVKNSTAQGKHGAPNEISSGRRSHVHRQLHGEDSRLKEENALRARRRSHAERSIDNISAAMNAGRRINWRCAAA